jgi:hypothetical protein
LQTRKLFNSSDNINVWLENWIIASHVTEISECSIPVINMEMRCRLHVLQVAITEPIKEDSRYAGRYHRSRAGRPDARRILTAGGVRDRYHGVGVGAGVYLVPRAIAKANKKM